jgi:uncharacterized protein YjbI with pentapeptide repeats
MTAEELLARYAKGQRDFRGVILRGADLRQADLSFAVFQGADLTAANLGGANLFRSDLSRACLCEARLARVNGQQANFEWADLRRAMIYQANLHSATLASATLSPARLDDSTLAFANMHDANLRGADLSRTDLRGAVLCGADLRGAILWRSRIKDSDWTGTIGPDGRRGKPVCPGSSPFVWYMAGRGARIGAGIGARYWGPGAALLGAVAGFELFALTRDAKILPLASAIGWCIAVVIAAALGSVKGAIIATQEPSLSSGKRYVTPGDWWSDAA